MRFRSLKGLIKQANKVYQPTKLVCNISDSLKKQQFKAELIQFYQNGLAHNESYLERMINSIKNSRFQQIKPHFVTTLLPDRPPLQLIIFYLEILYREIDLSRQSSMKYSNKYSLFFIGINLHTIYRDKIQDQTLQNQQLEEYYNHLARSTLISFLQYYRRYPMTTDFDSKFHLKILLMSMYLKIYNPYLLEYFKKFVQTDFTKFTLLEILRIMTFLAEDRSLPYQFFYKRKMDWIHLLQSSEKFSKKRISSSISYLKIFTKEKLVNCERIIQKLLQIIIESQVAMDQSQLIQTLYLYSRIKYGVDSNFVSSLIKRINQTVNFKLLNQKLFTLLVKALGSLNYQSQSLITKLQIINYDLFIASLRFNSGKLGNHYQLILKEIDTSISENSCYQEPSFHAISQV